MEISELQNTQLSVENADKLNSSQLVEQVEMENSPFIIRKNENNKWFATFGNYAITEECEDEEEVREKFKGMEAVNWKLMATLVAVFVDGALQSK